VGVLDNFFGLGGHSLHSIKLIAKIAERFTTQLSAIDVFRYPTIGEMGKLIEATHSRLESAALGPSSFTGQAEFDEGVLEGTEDDLGMSTRQEAISHEGSTHEIRE
jgi:hypothetical protein